MQSELEKAGWKVDLQFAEMMGHPIQNIAASRTSAPPEIILGAHYDSRLLADQDQGPGQVGPVPGANDGASGVAVLLELARTLPSHTLPIELVFLDAEDNGDLPGWDWLLGSRAFVAVLTEKPRAAIILDMIGDANLNIYIERNSNPQLVDSIWTQAAALGYADEFIPAAKYSMLDDHTPFLEAGIPAVDIIDFDYPYWHTASDTADKVSAESLQIVGRTMWAWLVAQK
jgi:Zn-dependent M28 family amino/carboxypeptidase